ncbi:MAG: hypothetical protein HOC91_18435 [Nitrospinaceae bacterium]|nr:hypothetical protein [Nitrospinaceae bacterium]MBT3822005.1 hypothetical protein [Nitrospinaceae bacterium]MBT4094734.1 hypothetical protein [Nitrospinaceae bacterium]MBT4432492.1 hypothetical protein [Nitrospinaceae bacterium]MBT5367907.1 hypothetical protein [Nitrospinaceae bacterium]
MPVITAHHHFMSEAAMPGNRFPPGDAQWRRYQGACREYSRPRFSTRGYFRYPEREYCRGIGVVIVNDVGKWLPLFLNTLRKSLHVEIEIQLKIGKATKEPDSTKKR